MHRAPGHSFLPSNLTEPGDSVLFHIDDMMVCLLDLSVETLVMNSCSLSIPPHDSAVARTANRRIPSLSFRDDTGGDGSNGLTYETK